MDSGDFPGSVRLQPDLTWRRLQPDQSDSAKQFELVQPDLFSASGGMPNAWADFDNDGQLTEFVGFRGRPNRLYRQDHARFEDVAAAAGIADNRHRRYGTKPWQRYGFEHVLRDDELTLVVARYILENPVRAGLVARVEDYPFVGSFVYELKEILEAAAEAEEVRLKPDTTDKQGNVFPAREPNSHKYFR
jgi:hypothetical protein